MRSRRMSDRKTLVVEVAGYTTPHLPTLDKYMENGGYNLNLAEFAGRNCYLSFDKPNPATADQSDYIRNIVNSGHLSVLEHISVTFYVTGVSRSFLAELTRHRHLAFSVVSQRYVDIERLGYVVPPALESDEEYLEEVQYYWDEVTETYSSHVRNLKKMGFNNKQAREASRSVAPQMSETRIVVTGNLRTWREIIQKRLTPHADQEFQRFAAKILEFLDRMYPAAFEDLKEAYSGE